MFTSVDSRYVTHNQIWNIFIGGCLAFITYFKWYVGLLYKSVLYLPLSQFSWLFYLTIRKLYKHKPTVRFWDYQVQYLASDEYNDCVVNIYGNSKYNQNLPDIEDILWKCEKNVYYLLNSNSNSNSVQLWPW